MVLLGARDDLCTSDKPPVRLCLCVAIIVGFALESDDGQVRAKQKLERKQLDLVVLNMAREPGAGFETGTNRVSLITKDDVEDRPRMPKSEGAERLLDRVEALL